MKVGFLILFYIAPKLPFKNDVNSSCDDNTQKLSKF